MIDGELMNFTPFPTTRVWKEIFQCTGIKGCYAMHSLLSQLMGWQGTIQIQTICGHTLYLYLYFYMYLYLHPLLMGWQQTIQIQTICGRTLIAQD